MRILKLLKSREMHGYEICGILSASGETVQLGYLYKILMEMSNEGLIKSYSRKSVQGPNRKVYGLDANGRKELRSMLREAIGIVHDFYGDYLAQLPTEKGLLEWERLIAGEFHGPKAVIFVLSRPSVLAMYRKALERYCREMGQNPVYVVSEHDVAFDLNLDNLVHLKGSHVDIPLKNNFADFVVALDPPRSNSVVEAVAEFHRVAKEGGASVLGFPNIDEREDPLSIGAFIERIEYGLEDSKQLSKEGITSVFKKYFGDVFTVKVLDFTFFIGQK